MQVNNDKNENIENSKAQEVILKSVKGFYIKKREFDKKLYLQHICNKENRVIAELLASRGVKISEKDDFFAPKLKNLLPKADFMKSTAEAVKRILMAIEKNERVCIFGDYDVDGLTSTSMWILFFKQLGLVVNYYIPDRILEGYGPNTQAVEKISKNGVTLLISVDCGTTAFEALQKAKQLGMDVIIIDHHQSDDKIPDCIACINPNRKDEVSISGNMKCLCACGVSFFVLMAVNKALKQWSRDVNLMHFVPLVAFATICDVMQLTPLNRAFIKTGINVLQKEKSFNLLELLNVANNAKNVNKDKVNNIDGQENKTLTLTANTFGFLLGPMVNAGGRIGNASLGVELMIEQDKHIANVIAEKLYDLNEERKDIETQTLNILSEKKQDIQQQIAENGYIIMYSQEWHEGIIGLIASRLKDKYCYPVLIGTEAPNGVIKFSCRSVDGVDIGAIILEAKEKGLLINGGGHKLAGGFSCDVSKIEQLKGFLREKIKNIADLNFMQRTKEYDVLLSLGGLTIELLEKISHFEPFGVGNPRPLFLIQDVYVKNVMVVKEKHISLFITDAENFERAMCFNCIGTELGNMLLLSKGKIITLLATADLGQWNGKNCKNIRIEDVILV